MRISFVSLLTAALCSALLFSTLPSRGQNSLDARGTTIGENTAVRLIVPVGHRNAIEALAVSADGRFALSGGYDHTAVLWEVATRREILRLKDSEAIFHCAFVDGVAGRPLRLFTLSADRAILWDAVSGKRLMQKDAPDISGAKSKIEDGALSPDGRTMAIQVERFSGGFLRLLRLYDAKTGAELTKTSPSVANLSLSTPVFSPDSMRLLMQPSSINKSGQTYVLNIATGALLKPLQAPGGSVWVGDPHFVSGGKQVVALCGPAESDRKNRNNSLLVWSWPDGVLLHTFPNLGPVGSFAVAPEGTQAAFAGFKPFLESSNQELQIIRTLSLRDGHVLSELNLKSRFIGAIAYLPRSTGFLVVGDDLAQSLFQVNAAGTKIVQTFGDPGIRKIEGFAPTAGGGLVGLVDATPLPAQGAPDPSAALSAAQLRFWDFRRAAFVGPAFDFSDAKGVPVSATVVYVRAAVSADGSHVAASMGLSNSYAVWDARTGKRQTFETPKNPDRPWSSRPWLSPDGSLVAVEHGNQVSVYDTRTQSQVEWKERKMWFDCAAFSWDNRFLISGHFGLLQVWDAATGKLLREWQSTTIERNTNDFIFLPHSNDRAISISRSSQVALWNLDTGALIREYSKPDETVDMLSAAVTGDGKKLAVGGSDGVIRLWDVESGASLGTLRGHSFDVSVLAWQGGDTGPRLVSASQDGTTRFWKTDAGTMRETVAAVLLATPTARVAADKSGLDWVAFRSDGTFEGSAGGTARVHFSRGLQTFAVDQFSEAFFRPGLFAAAVSGQDEDIISPPPHKTIDRVFSEGAPPTVQMTVSAAAPTIEITVDATAQAGGGVKAIRLYQNGRLVGGPPGALRGIVVEAVSGTTTTKKFVVSLASGVNVFRAVAYSRTGVESAPAESTFSYSAPQITRPTLYVLAVGINAYKDSTMNLAYARPDADSIASFFETKGKENGALFGAVKVTRLLDEAATGAAIRHSLAEVGAESLPDDVVFVYLAGHGETAPPENAVSTDSVFYFLPAEMRQIALAERVRAIGIAGSEIDTLLSKVKARKIILVYDACKSGAAITGGTRGAAEEQKALETLARAQGIHILTAATGQQYASEVKELGHGILTYALLEGLNGRAASGTDPDIYIRGLMSYVEDRVPELTRKYRGSEQYPVPFERGQNFPLVGK